MKIILLENVKGNGKKDEIKEVKDGFGNFLIKSKKAVSYSEKSKEVLKTQLENKKEEEDRIYKEALELKSKLEKTKLTFKVKTGVQDKVFGSISSKQISEELKKKNLNVDKKIIDAENINSLGMHLVKIKLHKKVTAELNVELKGGE